MFEIQVSSHSAISCSGEDEGISLEHMLPTGLVCYHSKPKVSIYK